MNTGACLDLTSTGAVVLGAGHASVAAVSFHRRQDDWLLWNGMPLMSAHRLPVFLRRHRESAAH